MNFIEQKLESLGLRLEGAKPPVGNYLGCKVIGDLLYASGRVSELKGVIGTDVSHEQARQAARDTVLLILSIVKQEIGNLDMIDGVVKVQGFLRCSPDFIALPNVLDGASDLLITLFGEKGKHARTATGVAQLPFGASIQLDMIFQLKK
ncbi:MAG: RidA family protein [Flavobacteriales bacterium]